MLTIIFIHLSKWEKTGVGLYILFLAVASFKAWREDCDNKRLLRTFEGRYQITVNKMKFIKAVISWCSSTLGYPSGYRKLPGLEVSYYKNKKLLGVYYFSKRSMKIFVNNHATAQELIDTIIHEYIHFLEINSTSTEKEYTKYHMTLGFEKNPYEISARKSMSHVPAAVEFLINHHYLKKL